MVSQKTLKDFDVLLVDRDDRRKVYVASHTEPQPKKVIVHEYFGIVEGRCFHSLFPYPPVASILSKTHVILIAEALQDLPRNLQPSHHH